MTTGRAVCGSKRGVLAHHAGEESLCVLCRMFIDAELVEVERRRPTPEIPEVYRKRRRRQTDLDLEPPKLRVVS